MAGPSVKDFLLFHKIDRMAYNKFVFYCEAEPGTVRKVVALFMWLEKLNIRILLRIVKIDDLSTIRKIFAEAEAVLQCLQQNDGQSFDADLPIITSITENRTDIGFFNSNRDLMMRNLVGILDGVGRIVFDDDIHALLNTYEEQQVAAEATPGAARPRLPAALAAPFNNSAVVAPSTQENRSMLVGFDVTCQINSEEISEYFTKRWGDCIEQVLISKRVRAGETTVYGKVAFKSPTYISLALKGDQTVRYSIESGKELCAYKYKWSFSKHL